MKLLSFVQYITVVLVFSLVSACSDDAGVTLHEAHVYKGNVDVHKESAQIREQRLQLRARQVFTDR
ncbi:MAG TPA: hypothetical protein ENJ32_14145 [Crenotrichaceae bacterium]|nr:hypothetical protein [Crenotrichaceae bacterium]